MAKIVLSARVDGEVVKRLDDAAAYLRMTRSDLVQDILRQFVRKSLEEVRQDIENQRAEALHADT